MKENHIYQGSALEVLKTFPDESIDCCMTSPPYWNLRDYGVEGQIGLEPTFKLYITNLCSIFDEVKRVLKPQGSCWINLGDSYSTQSGGMAQGKYGKLGTNVMDGQKIKQPKTELKDKCLCMIPERFAIKMINNGWILRNQIIWRKPNAMPSSSVDRFTVDFEKVFFFVKETKYHFKQQLEPIQNSTISRVRYPRCNEDSKGASGNYGISATEYGDYSNGRNMRTTWDISLKPFGEAHFATYPEKLVETPLKSGCPEEGIVLDPFFGAGTTGLVALKQNKKFIGIELNPEYIEIANKRLKPHLEQTRLNTAY